MAKFTMVPTDFGSKQEKPRDSGKNAFPDNLTSRKLRLWPTNYGVRVRTIFRKS